ncbi:MAG TPA: prepilin-type N-terminal cleavage/methylation domain-containing protein [Blastocatellia bacterium]|nr:prepilin-type N-terminal cleavage/methylation domain-containing protein [Blastocatellia bacterium]
MFLRRGSNQTRTIPNTRQRGFSMIEMAVVLLIIAIIAAAALPQVVNYMRRYRLGVASRNIATALQRARFIATSNNSRAGVFIPESRRVEIEQYDLEGKKEPEKKGTILLPEGISIASNAPQQIAFDGRGVITPLPKESPSIRINGASGYFMIVTVSPTGQVTVSDPMREEGA